MPAPPTQTGPVLVSQSPVLYSVLRDPGLTIDGGAGQPWRAEVTYRVKAKDLYAFAQFLTGKAYTVNLTGGGTATRVMPATYPDGPTLLCKTVKGSAKGGYTAPDPASGPFTGKTATLSNWSDAAVTATFEGVPYPTDGGTPFMVTETRAGAEVYTLAGSKLHFASDSTLIQADAGVTVPTTVYTVTINLAATLNDAVLNPLLGSVNNATFLGNAAGTFRFDGFNSASTTLGGGQQTYTRTILLTFRPIPWNQFLRPDGVWEAALTPGGANVYASADLSPLVS